MTSNRKPETLQNHSITLSVCRQFGPKIQEDLLVGYHAVLQIYSKNHFNTFIPTTRSCVLHMTGITRLTLILVGLRIFNGGVARVQTPRTRYKVATSQNVVQDCLDFFVSSFVTLTNSSRAGGWVTFLQALHLGLLFLIQP
jgi:hypothetical protein